MTTATPLARSSAVEGALPSGGATAGLYHSVGHDRRARGDDADVATWRMSDVSFRPGARCQAPTFGAVAGMAVGIGDAVLIIDPRMPCVLLPVVGIAVFQPARVEATE